MPYYVAGRILLNCTQSARELTAVVWGHELALTLQHCERILSEDAEADRKVIKSLAGQQKTALREIWDDPPGDIFELR